MIGLEFWGTDGSYWDLRNGPVQVLQKGLEGLGKAPIEFFQRATAGGDGEELTGWRAKPRPVFLPLLLGVNTNEETWEQLERDWWSANRVGKYARLRATLPSGAWRELSMRYQDDGGQAYEVDPSVDAFSIVGLNYRADKQPWWTSAPVSRSFRSGDVGVNFFGGAGATAGPPFVIARANLAGGVVLNNPGDLDAWPVFRIEGPSSAFDATIDGATVGGNIEVGPGEVLTVNTNPRVQTALLEEGGVVRNVTPQLTQADFRRVPAGDSRNLQFSIYGEGLLTVELQPIYERAW